VFPAKGCCHHLNCAAVSRPSQTPLSDAVPTPLSTVTPQSCHSFRVEFDAGWGREKGDGDRSRRRGRKRPQNERRLATARSCERRTTERRPATVRQATVAVPSPNHSRTHCHPNLSFQGGDSASFVLSFGTKCSLRPSNPVPYAPTPYDARNSGSSMLSSILLPHSAEVVREAYSRCLRLELGFWTKATDLAGSPV
jgi:hypothetical protein